MKGSHFTETAAFWQFRKDPEARHRDVPLPLAEELPFEVVTEGMRHFSESKTPDGLLHSSWRMLEYALAHDTPLDAPMRKTYISHYVSQLLADVLAMSKYDNPLCSRDPDYHSSPQQNSYHQALQIGAYLPLFTKRATGEVITSEDCRNLHHSLIALMKEELSLGDDLHDSRLSENVASALGTRTAQPEFIAYITSPREEASHQAHYNHDRYFLQDGQKVPVQIKIGAAATHRYDSPVQVLDIESLLHFAGTKASIAPAAERLVAPEVYQAAQLLVLEASGDYLYPEERTYLNVACQALVGVCAKPPSVVKAA